MNPRSENVAKASELLDTMLGGGDDAAAAGEGAETAGERTAPTITRTVQPVAGELAEAEEQRSPERVQRTRSPNKNIARTRDVMGRFKPPTDASEATAAKEGKTMAREGDKSPPPADGTDEKATGEAVGERKTDAAVPAATKDETPADARVKRAQEAIARIRAARAAQKETASTKTRESSLREQEANAKRELEAVQAEKARWEAARKSPVEGFKALGLNPSDAFLELAQAAREANTPEAKIAAVTALFEQKLGELSKTVESLQGELSARDEAAERTKAEAEFMTVAKRETHPYSHAYIAAEAKKQGVAPGVLWSRAMNACADAQRANGKNPSYKSIADEIEEYAAEVVLEMLSQLPKDAGANTETAPGTKAQDDAKGPTETKGKAAALNGSGPRSIGNDLATSRSSNASRRRSLAERQKLAEGLVFTVPGSSRR